MSFLLYFCVFRRLGSASFGDMLNTWPSGYANLVKNPEFAPSLDGLKVMVTSSLLFISISFVNPLPRKNSGGRDCSAHVVVLPESSFTSTYTQICGLTHSTLETTPC